MTKRILTVLAAIGGLSVLAVAMVAAYALHGRADLASRAQSAVTAAEGGEGGDVDADAATPIEDFVIAVADGVGAGVDAGPGLVVSALVKDGPAARAGVQRGDILLQVGGQAVNHVGDVAKALQGRTAGETVALEVQHGDDRRTLTATLDDKRAGILGIVPCAPGAMRAAIRAMPLGPQGGARVEAIQPDSPAATADLKAGDFIHAVDGQELDADHTLSDLIAARKPGDVVTLSVHRLTERRIEPASDDAPTSADAPATADDTGEGPVVGTVTIEAKAEPTEVKVTLGEHPDKPGTAYLGVSYVSGPGMMFFEHDGPHGAAGTVHAFGAHKSGMARVLRLFGSDDEGGNDPVEFKWTVKVGGNAAPASAKSDAEAETDGGVGADDATGVDAEIGPEADVFIAPGMPAVPAAPAVRGDA